MQLSDAKQVVQVATYGEANKKLADGWKLLAVLPSADDAGLARVAYVLGKTEPQPAKPSDLFPPRSLSDLLVKD